MAQLAPVSHAAPVPPQNLEAEESVLGAMMLSPGAIGAVSEIVDAGDFYRESHTKLCEAGEDVTGIPSGFRELDKLTSGFQPGNLIIVAARPSMGKSALGLCIAANLAVRHGRPVALFTLEMSKAEVTQRLMCSEG